MFILGVIGTVFVFEQYGYHCWLQPARRSWVHPNQFSEVIVILLFCFVCLFDHISSLTPTQGKGPRKARSQE